VALKLLYIFQSDSLSDCFMNKRLILSLVALVGITTMFLANGTDCNSSLIRNMPDAMTTVYLFAAALAGTEITRRMLVIPKLAPVKNPVKK
jgi:hypothetical protein